MIVVLLVIYPIFTFSIPITNMMVIKRYTLATTGLDVACCFMCLWIVSLALIISLV